MEGLSEADRALQTGNDRADANLQFDGLGQRDWLRVWLVKLHCSLRWTVASGGVSEHRGRRETAPKASRCVAERG